MINIYCDGSSKGNPGIGGFGIAVIENNIYVDIYSKQYENITNNQAELKALLFALGLATTKYNLDKVTIYSDSAYTVNLFNNWIFIWARNGWLTANKEPIKNKELVLQLYNFAKKEFPNFYVTKISGHNGIIGNEIADAAATFNQAKLEKIFLENKDIIVKGKVFENF